MLKLAASVQFETLRIKFLIAHFPDKPKARDTGLLIPSEPSSWVQLPACQTEPPSPPRAPLSPPRPGHLTHLYHLPGEVNGFDVKGHRGDYKSLFWVLAAAMLDNLTVTTAPEAWKDPSPSPEL